MQCFELDFDLVNGIDELKVYIYITYNLSISIPIPICLSIDVRMCV